MKRSETPAYDPSDDVPEDVREEMRRSIRQLREHDPASFLAAIARLLKDCD